MTVRNTINWFEVPVTNIARAMKFYGTVLDMKMETTEFQGTKMAFLAFDRMGVTGALVEGEGCTPSQTGTVVYFNGGDDLATPLARVTAAGGKVVIPKTSIGEHGYFAHFMDTEGNRVALHSMK